MHRLFAAITLASALIALPSLAQDATPQRYAVELQFIEAGKDVVQATTFVAVGGSAKVTLIGDQDQFEFNASLDAQQGDGADDLLISEINLVRNGEEIASPRLMMRRTGTARYEVGAEGAEVVRVTIKPAP
ncbi:hypothetical protein DA69_06705 [Brevundimonas naejangsanensis]|uniref:Uncharacterized protein n=1 Tax=Brevundimonas naejangsanensis TaxID=588932 RepID=A0A172Y5F1_9CAUL|nr:hypothetical protein [Brevundimonas naejangsanensis]ANF54454.1 hypothetical protein DA69_06705 [Brevundimonas naejangsanensis]